MSDSPSHKRCADRKQNRTFAERLLSGSLVRPDTMQFFGKTLKTRKMRCKLPDRTPRLSVYASIRRCLLTVILTILTAMAGAELEQGGVRAADVSLGLAEANQLLSKSVKMIESQHSISADVAHFTDLFGKKLLGKGVYCEDRSGPRPLVRFELKVPIGESESTLLQISDGKFLWIYRVFMENAYLDRVDLERIAAALTEQGRAGQGAPASGGLGMLDSAALSGAAGLIMSLREAFSFDMAERETLYDTPVWKLRGRWRGDRLAALLPDQAEAIEQGRGEVDLSRLPPQLPDQVFIWLGKDDLFPYRIEYRRRDAGAAGSQNARTIAAMQFMRVSFNVPLDPNQFVFEPNKAPIADRTGEYIEKLSRRGKNP